MKYNSLIRTYQNMMNAITSVNIGIYFMLLSVSAYTLRDTINKSFLDLPPIEIVFFANIIGVIYLYTSMKMDRPVAQSNKGNKKLLIFRSLTGFFASATIFYLIAQAPFVNAVLFVEMQVIISATFMYFYFSEKLSSLQSIAIIVGFIGVVLIVFPQDDFVIEYINVIGIVCAIAHAAAFVSIRELRRHYESRVVALSFVGGSAIGAAICMIIAQFTTIPSLDFMIEKFVIPDFETSLLLLLIGIFSTLAQLYKTKAYMNGKVGIIGVTGYSRVAFAFIVGILLGDHIPNIIVGAGIILVTLSGIMVSYHNYPQKTKNTYKFK